MPPITIDIKVVYSDTLEIPVDIQPKQVLELMAKLARFQQRLAVEILAEKDGKMAMVSAANPAANSLLQCAATLEHGAMNFDALLKQQAGLIGGQPMQRGPQRPPFAN
jgi:hypothetical protein